jgi:hypothetical protein
MVSRDYIARFLIHMYYTATHKRPDSQTEVKNMYGIIVMGYST